MSAGASFMPGKASQPGFRASCSQPTTWGRVAPPLWRPDRRAKPWPDRRPETEFLTDAPAADKIASLMASALPRLIAPARLAEARGRLEGRLALRGMTRLCEVLGNARGGVNLRLAFDRDEQGFVRVSGGCEAELELVCQRCLEAFAVKQACEIRVGVVFDSAAIDELPGDLEPLLLEQETIALSEFIEDEILLGLPIAPLHPPAACAVAVAAGDPAMEVENPFHALQALRETSPRQRRGGNKR